MSCAPIALDGFRILARGNTDIELLIKESLLIADQRPILNSNISSLELRVFNYDLSPLIYTLGFVDVINYFNDVT